ncbi:hypothetical protein FHX42_000916 [Saccharopolyspora lacisalsi]|uniref:DUF3558 domain-containing protein n=1 Tax=Halosaccharopolyspora lacisalsi TaxID=1000566 RepID=A0A839DVX7_9PSEU|nr:DUF3558 family protein [Halosaccharopolyspora lacisalsi]MBA8823587.1 hypothetical protein [Halosaccharopolyspora lacisalsi]
MAAAAGVALVGVAGCGTGGIAGDTSPETTSASSSKDDLASVQPCQMLPPETLESFGLEVTGEPRNELPWQPGCDFDGKPISATLIKNTRQTVSSAEKKTVWAKFERIQVNGRSGAQAITQGTTKARLCNVMFNAGKGTIQVQAHEISPPDDIDECAKALEIAKKIEPNVPDPA